MDKSRIGTNKSTANSSLENGQKGKRKNKHRSEKQVERCRKYREKQSAAVQNNATAEDDKYTYGHSTNVYSGVPFPPFQITCLSIPGATPMHQPFYLFSPGVIPPAHILENMSKHVSILQEDSIQSKSASAKYQENSYHPGSTRVEDCSGQNTQNQKEGEAGNHDNDRSDTSLDESALSSKENDYDMVGIMSVFTNSTLHCAINMNSHSDDKPGEDFGYAYFTISNLSK